MRLETAEVIEDDFDLTNNKFSYTSLKELAAKVPSFFWSKTKSRHTAEGDG